MGRRAALAETRARFAQPAILRAGRAGADGGDRPESTFLKSSPR